MATAQIAPAARQRLLPPETGRASFGDALRSEFTKIKSTRSTYWTLFALVVVCVGIGALACAGTASHPQGVSPTNFDATQQSLAGLYVGQLVIAVLGALTITSEYSTGMIRTSLSVQPRRGVVFAAKAVVFAAVTLVIGLITSFASFFVGQAILSSHHLSATLGEPNVLRAVIGGALFLTACGMLAYGLGAVLRHTAAAITAAIGLLFVLTVLVQFLPQSWQDNVDKWMPALAGSQIWVSKAAGAGPGWHDGHQNVTRSCWPSERIGVPQRRHGRPRRPYTQVSSPRRQLPVVTWPIRSLLASSRRRASSAMAPRSVTDPAGCHGLTPRRNSTSALYRVPIPARLRWSSRASPMGRAGSADSLRTASAQSQSGPSRSGPR